MPTTILVLRELAYEIEGSIQLPDWYDPKLHKYNYHSCEVQVFKNEQNIWKDEPIWVGDLNWDDDDDCERDVIDERVFEK